MNTTVQQTYPNSFIQQSLNLSGRGGALSASRHAPGRVSFAALFALLLLLLWSAPLARADQDPPGCTGSGLGILLYTDAADVHIGDTLHYSVTVFNGTGTGPVVCDATSIQAFIVTPDGKTNQITLVRTSLTNGQSDFYSNAASYVCRAQDIQPDQTVDATAFDTGVIHQNINNSEGGGNQGVNTQVSLPCILLTMQCTGGVGQSGLLSFTGTITNCGNDTLVGVTVTNFDNNGHQTQVAFITNILAGQVAPFSGSWMPLSPCNPSTVTLTVEAVDQFTTYPKTVTSSITNTCSETLTAGIVVTKTCPVTPVAPGQLLTFSGSVSNTGNVTLTNIVVVNTQPVPNTTVYTLASLAPGAISNFTGSYTAPASCSVADTLAASAASVCGVAVNSSVSATCPILTTPQIAVTQNCPVNPVSPDGLLTYSGTVSNAGNIMLTNVVILNNLSGATPVFTAAALPPGAVSNFTGSYLTPTNCSSASTSTATAESICGVAVTNSASTTCPITTTPMLAVTQTCPVNPAVPGGPLVYSGTVSNAGNITITNVVVVNNLSGAVPVIGPLTLAPGIVVTFTGGYLAPASCSSTSTSTATGQSVCGMAVTNSASATCPISTTPVLAVTQTCPTNTVIPGGLLTYSGTVSNAGNITLTNVVVLNNQSGSTPVFTTATLTPGAAANFTGSYLAPSNCTSASTSTATGQSICGVAVTNSASTTCPITTTPVLAVTQNCSTNTVIPGGLLTYSGTVSNAGNITVTNVVVLNNLSGSTPVLTAATLAPGAASNYTGSYLAPAACSSTSTSTATGKSICGVAVTNAASTTCPITTAPVLAVTQNCSTNTVIPGGLLTYSGAVSNAGNIMLTNLVVLNNRSGSTPIFTAATMAPGAVSNFTGSYVAPAACSDPSTSTATAQSICGVAVTNSASTTCPITTTPVLAVTEVCPVNPAIPGGLLTYSGTVSNAGNITLTNIIVRNNLSGSTPVFTAAVLPPGAVSNFTGSYLAPTNCITTSTSTATGQSICGVSVTNAASATCPINTTPVLAVTEVCPVIPAVPGGLLTYSGTVSNAGNITITNVVILNNLSGSTPVLTVAALAPGAVSNYTGSYLAPAACFSTSTSTATGWSTCGVAVTNAASTTCPITTTPLLAVTQICPVNPVIPGGLLTYSGTVSNTGNIALTNVVVLNNATGSTPVFTAATLAPGAGASFTGSYLAPASCVSASTSTATAQSICGVAVTNSASTTCSIVTAPAIAVIQICPVTPAVPGSLLTYSGTVSNTGNITLTNVIVLNNLSGSTPVFGPAILPPGVGGPFTGSYLAPASCFSTSTSTATGRSICGVAVTNAMSATCPILTAPAITVSQTCPTNPVAPGGILTYSGTVSNAGNILLTNIIVMDNRPVTNTVIFTLPALAPGAATNFTGSYQVPLNCCEVWSTVDASGQGCAGVTVTDTATRVCAVLTSPQLVVTKVCAPGILRWGDLLTYSGTVSNAGNISMVDVTVVNNESPDSLLLGPITLAPGESQNYTASYIIPPDYCGADTVTASGLDICLYSPTTSSATTICPVIIPPPSIALAMYCPAQPTPRGGLYTYTGSVSNSGAVTLVNVFVVNNYPTNNTPVLGPITLAPGASANASFSFTNSYIAPGCCCFILDILTARGQDHCLGSNATAEVATECPLLSTPSITVVQNCPPNPIPMGSVYAFNGYVTNTGNTVLTNVFVFGPQGTNTPLLVSIELAPGESQPYSGSYTVPTNTCSVSVTAFGQDICGGTPAINIASCPVAATPAIAVTESCPPGPVTLGSIVTFGGSVSNSGNITLDNIFVFSSQPSNNSPLLGPITLGPGASAPFTGSYVATGGSNPTTNATIVTNGSSTITTNMVTVITTNNTAIITTNTVTPTFGDIDPVLGTLTDRFSVPANLHGLMYADQNENWGPALFYVIRLPVIGADEFDTISTVPPGSVTDQFALTSSNYDALTLAAPDVGYGSVNFYYVRHNNPGVSVFGEIIAQGASSSADLWTLANLGYNALTFAAADLGYGANLFYYLREDATGHSTFGTINPTPGGAETDLYGVGTNFDSLVYVSGAVSTWGTSIFAYLRHNATGSIIGTINPVSHAVTDRISLGTNFLNSLTFTATDVGYGPNLFYYLRPAAISFTTNIVTTFTSNTVITLTTNSVTTYTTNIVVSFTPTNNVNAVGLGLCLGQSVAAAANCLGSISSQLFEPEFGAATVLANGNFSLSFHSQNGISYTVEYNNTLNNATWTGLETVIGTGANISITDPFSTQRPARFYRVILTP
jgi:hypothetical protein